MMIRILRQMVARRALIALIVCGALAGDAAAQQQGPPQVGQVQAAQPAPVPAVVAIPRPSATDVETARRSLARFVETADPATRAILQKYPALLEVRTPPPNTAIIPNLAPNFRAKHEANLEVARRGDSDVLFMGDSITDFWRNETGQFAGKPILDKYFSQWKVANFGIAGDTTQGVLYRLQNGEGRGFSPRAIMLMIGTNNGGNTGPEIAEGVGAVVLEMRKDFPDAKILLLAIFPRAVPGDPVRDKIAEANRIISRLDDQKHVFYMDIGAKFLDDKGVFLPDTFRPDNLHPLAKGYDIWGEAVKDKLAELMKQSPGGR